MLGIIWCGMILTSIVCSFLTGRADELAAAVTDGADQGIKLCIAMAGIMCLWSGIMRIADKSGITMFISRCLSPILSRLMPEHPSGGEAMRAVSANITANILGLGNAATPLGISAMKALKKESSLSDIPDHSMIMFVIINTASLQIIPTTAAALRQAAGSTQPYSIIPYVWIASLGGLAAGVGAALLMRRIGGVSLRKK